MSELDPRMQMCDDLPSTDEFPDLVVDMVMKLEPILAGNHSSIVGSALAVLTAKWVAGHCQRGRNGEVVFNNKMHQQLIAFFVKMVETRLPENIRQYKRDLEHMPWRNL